MTPPTIAPVWFDDELEDEVEVEAGGGLLVGEGDCTSSVGTPLVSVELRIEDELGVVLGVNTIKSSQRTEGFVPLTFVITSVCSPSDKGGER